MSHAISVRISETLLTALDDVAKATQRPRAFHIQKAIEAYLDEYADLQIAADRLHDATDPIISVDEMRQKLGLSNHV
jgi:RHH-type transcriptional regulator, rel operon repressor / antitoxin RelB